MPETFDTTTLILCGGLGTRMGGIDKPLQLWRTKPLLAHVLNRVPTNSKVIVSANRNLASYRKLCPDIVQDHIQGLGPLGGIATVCVQLETTWLFVVPGDMPLLPRALCEAFRAQLSRTSEAAIITRTPERTHYLPLLIRTDATGGLSDYLASGARSVQGWLSKVGYTSVDVSSEARAFANFNTPQDFEDSTS